MRGSELDSRSIHGGPDELPTIHRNRAKRSGKLCIRGLLIAVYDVLGQLGSGMAEDNMAGMCRTSPVTTFAPA